MSFILVLFLAAVVAWFATQNQEPVLIRLFGPYVVAVQVIWLILGSVAVGALITYGLGLSRASGRRSSADVDRRLQEQQKRLEEQGQKLKEIEAKLGALEESVRRQEQKAAEWSTPTGS
ncbi:MAG: lipopolysaccharide assembly protein LapA domain-containing protein [Armatimonadota bacterium]|nr:lipopolysaccharide assembly protein LapA domain-containing protein [Armatimonadota bacterium]MDR5702564.1 lipopolysaccharide assembly protein LapA domain-containing protein [Armatimonadota bacterium]MDR7433744.1 lipopolysaccharide assembly protein LapA domain-containing protein [Armatimonadota bacterium]